ncbi:MAG: hypothetical protein SFW67_27870 [Myxococcaceae bacterium]|nr:hypothetical protein [Myxococcaceae bacterium]
MLVCIALTLTAGCNGSCPPIFAFCTPVWTPLTILSWKLEAGAKATVEAEFETKDPVFREHFDAPNYGELGLTTLDDSSGTEGWFALRRDVDPEFGPFAAREAEVDIVTQWRFRFVSRAPLEAAPTPPFTLHIGVRRGEGPAPGWPNIEARVLFGPDLVTQQIGPP